MSLGVLERVDIHSAVRLRLLELGCFCSASRKIGAERCETLQKWCSDALVTLVQWLTGSSKQGL